MLPITRIRKTFSKEISTEWSSRNKIYLPTKKMDDFKGVFDNPDSQELLAIVTSVHHETAGETFNNGALSFSEPFGRISTS